MDVRSRLTNIVLAFREKGVIPTDIIRRVPEEITAEMYEKQSYKLTSDESLILAKRFGDNYGYKAGTEALTGPVEMLCHYIDSRNNKYNGIVYYHSNHYSRFKSHNESVLSASTSINDIVPDPGEYVIFHYCKYSSGFGSGNTNIESYVDDTGIFAKLFKEHIVKPAETNLNNIQALLSMPTIEDKLHLLNDLLGDDKLMDSLMSDPSLRAKIFRKMEYMQLSSDTETPAKYY